MRFRASNEVVDNCSHCVHRTAPTVFWAGLFPASEKIPSQIRARGDSCPEADGRQLPLVVVTGWAATVEGVAAVTLFAVAPDDELETITAAVGEDVEMAEVWSVAAITPVRPTMATMLAVVTTLRAPAAA